MRLSSSSNNHFQCLKNFSEKKQKSLSFTVSKYIKRAYATTHVIPNDLIITPPTAGFVCLAYKL